MGGCPPPPPPSRLDCCRGGETKDDRYRAKKDLLEMREVRSEALSECEDEDEVLAGS